MQMISSENLFTIKIMVLLCDFILMLLYFNLDCIMFLMMNNELIGYISSEIRIKFVI